MAIQLTESACRRVNTMLAMRGAGIGLRLGTRKSGCSGYAYVIDFADEVAANDVVFETAGVKIVVDRDSLDFLDGTTLDYASNGRLNESFRFNNPNVADSCGCGESVNFTRSANG